MTKSYKSPFKHIMDGASGPVAVLDGKEYLYFAGVGYYALHNNDEIKQAAIKAIKDYGIASSTSRMLTGTTELLLKLENAISDFFDTEDAAYLPSGYLSNIAGISAIKQLGIADIVFIDEGSHYCNIEGALASEMKVVRFRHTDTDDLERKIKKELKKSQKPLIVTDGMFPVWGNVAPVDKYLLIAEKYDGAIWIDDAHPVGILGNNGRGTYDHYNISSERLFFGATLSKAFGGYGGFVAGKSDFIYAIKTGNVMRGSSSPVSAAIAAGLKGIEIVKNNPEMRERLWENARYLKKRLKDIGLNIEQNNIPIATFTTGNANDMQRIQNELMKKSIFIQYSHYVGAGANGVLRMVVFSEHSKVQIDTLVDRLYEILK